MADTVLLTAAHHPPWTEAVARTLAATESAGTKVQVLYVFDEEERDTALKNLNLEGRMVGLDELSRRKQDVSTAGAVLSEAGLEYEVEGRLNDDLGDAILSTAKAHDVDRIYLYSRRRSPVGKAVFGSALQKVILEATVPVVVTPEGAMNEASE